MKKRTEFVFWRRHTFVVLTIIIVGLCFIAFIAEDIGAALIPIIIGLWTLYRNRNSVLARIVLSQDDGFIVRGLFGKIVLHVPWKDIVEVGVLPKKKGGFSKYVYFSTIPLDDSQRRNIAQIDPYGTSIMRIEQSKRLRLALDTVYNGNIVNKDSWVK